MDYLGRIVASTQLPFIFIIDEWDAICREFEPGTKAMDNYVNWLRRLFKGGQSSRVFAGVYLTGILPIKKYNTQSALNNFLEYSMVELRKMGRYFGFTKEEVRTLAGKYDIIGMIAGERCKVEPTGFGNDMRDIHCKDDVLTVLIHLGYLSYNWRKDECYIPDREVAGEMVNAVKANQWKPVVDALAKSEKLLAATLAGDEEAVASGIETAHDENTSILSYNDVNSLSCVLSIAYYYARNDYVMHRELATGKGFADIVFIPRKNVDSPAIVVELKVRRDADAAIDQILRKDYPAKVAEYAGKLLLVGISYDKESKQHSCRIRKA